jgi:hypothetical protein
MTARATALALLLALTSCGLPANVVVLLPDENGTVGKVSVHEGDATAELTKPLAAVNAGSEPALRDVFTAQPSDVDKEFAGALAAAPRAASTYLLYFRPDRLNWILTRGTTLRQRSLRRKARPISISV